MNVHYEVDVRKGVFLKYVSFAFSNSKTDILLYMYVPTEFRYNSNVIYHFVFKLG